MTPRAADPLYSTPAQRPALTRRVSVSVRKAARRMESATGLHTSLGRTTASDILTMLFTTLLIGVAVEVVTQPMESGVNRCPSCPIGGPVWMINESDYVPIPDQMTTAGIVGVVVGLLFPLRRLHADGPVMFGMRTRYRRYHSFSGGSPTARIQNGLATSTVGRLSIFVILLVGLSISSVAAYSTGTTHTTHESYGHMKRLGERGPLYTPALGPCQGRHCVGCLSIRQRELWKRIRTWSA